MDKYQVENARISDTMLGFEDHGILTSFVYLDYYGSGQGFGGYSFQGFDKASKIVTHDSTAAYWIASLLNVLEQSKWESLKGIPCRSYHSHSKVMALGHYLRDTWVYIHPITGFVKVGPLAEVMEVAQL